MSVTLESNAYGTIKGNSMLDCLTEDQAKIFEVERNDDGTFDLVEACDRYFRAKVTKAQLLQLADELRALAV